MGDDLFGDGFGGLEPGEAGLLLMGAIGLDDAARAAEWLPLGAPELAASGVDPLSKAAEWGAERCARMLLGAGWDWRPSSPGKPSAMEAAASSGSAACVRAMLECSDPRDLGLWAKALARALGAGRVECAKEILSLRRFEDFDPADSAEAMALAIDSGSSGPLALLLAHGWPAQMRVGRVDPAPELLLEQREVGKSLDMESWGRAAGDLPRLPGSLSALAHACLGGRWEAVRELARRGADIHAPLRGGATPLMICARGQSSPTVAALLAAGAEPNARDSKGWTPLMWAAGYEVSVGNEAVVRSLLRAGADPEAEGPGGASPLEIFARRYCSQGDVDALCERVDPRPLLAAAAAKKASASAAAVKAMEPWAKHWQAREDAAKERGEIAANCLAGRRVRGAGRRM